MIFHEIRLPADDSHEISCLICYFWKKKSKIWNFRPLQIIGDALRVKGESFIIRQDSEVPKNLKPETDICLENIPETSKYLKVNKLEEEGKKMFDALLQFQASPHISR